MILVKINFLLFASCSFLMKNINLKIINQLLTNELVLSYALLSRKEYPLNNPVCSEKHLKWKYLDNPLGPSYGINGYYLNKLEGRISYQKKIFLFKNKFFKGANLCDLLVRKELRIFKNFLSLTNQFFISKDIPESDFGIMVPNEISIDLYKNVLKLKPIGKLELRCIPLIFNILEHFIGIKYLKFLNFCNLQFTSIFEKILNLIFKLKCSPDKVKFEEYSEMIKKYYNDKLIKGERSWDWHKWRYNKDSRIKYYVEYIYIRKKLIGYFAYRKIEKSGFNVILIMEIISIKKGFLIDLSILIKLIMKAIILKCDFIINLRTWQRNNLLNNYFIFPRIPNFLLKKPIELFLINKEKLDHEFYKIENWKINMADLDIF